MSLHGVTPANRQLAIERQQKVVIGEMGAVPHRVTPCPPLKGW
jgi:hypothetical protein